MIYFCQFIDKAAATFTSIFNFQQDANLVWVSRRLRSL